MPQPNDLSPQVLVALDQKARVRLCQGALSRAEEEYASPVRDLRAGQSVHRTPGSPDAAPITTSPTPYRHCLVQFQTANSYSRLLAQTFLSGHS